MKRRERREKLGEREKRGLWEKGKRDRISQLLRERIFRNSASKGCRVLPNDYNVVIARYGVSLRSSTRLNRGDFIDSTNKNLKLQTLLAGFLPLFNQAEAATATPSSLFTTVASSAQGG